MKKQPKKPVTLADIAGTASVTPMTVSRVINGTAKAVASQGEFSKRL